MMKKLLMFLVFLLPKMVSGQKPFPVIGVYSISSGNPEGGTHLYVLDSHKYVAVYFGGAQVGDWKLTQDSIITFTPYFEPNHFLLYGRVNKALKDSLRIHFIGFSDEETFINAGPLDATKPMLRRVFNPNPNCFGYPYVYNFKRQSPSMSFSFLPYQEEAVADFKPTIYTFNVTEGYNDFIAYHFEDKAENKPYYAIATASGLQFRGGNVTERQPLDLKGEDAAFIAQLSGAMTSPEEVLTNPFYKEYGASLKGNANYSFNAQKNAYISKRNYKEGEEYIPAGDAYNRMNIIYAFRKVTSCSQRQQIFMIEEPPLFVVRCGE